MLSASLNKTYPSFLPRLKVTVQLVPVSISNKEHDVLSGRASARGLVGYHTDNSMDPLSYFSFQSAFHNWVTKAVNYRACGVGVNDPLVAVISVLLNRVTIKNVLGASLDKSFQKNVLEQS